MARRKLFVHIGPPKTGSSSIQHMLHILAPSLEQYGVHVVAASSVHGNHSQLARREIDPQPDHVHSYRGRLYRWSDVLHELTRCNAERFVLSSELFARPEACKGGIRRLCWLESEADVEVEVVGYVRPQWQWAESSWCQSVRYGEELRRFEDCLKGWFVNPLLDYNQVFGPWRAGFGKVTVRPLGTGQLPRGHLAHFLGLMGVHDERLIGAAIRLPRQNVRLGAKALEVHRMVGVELARRGVQQPQRVRAMRRLGDLSHVLQEDWPFAASTREQALALNEHFAESNARFAREYGVDENGLLGDGLPQDDDKRGRAARWEHLSLVERRAARQHVSRMVGVDIEDALHGSSLAMRPPLDFSDTKRSSWGTKMGRQGRSLLRHVLRLTRALAQIRLSRDGFLFSRWMRWEIYEFWRRRLAALDLWSRPVPPGGKESSP